MATTTTGQHQITEEMQEFFVKRTKEHIDRVISNMNLMKGYQDLSSEQLQERGKCHDESKYQEPEREGYIWLSWWHHCRTRGVEFQYPEGIETLVQDACEHHLHSNLHHPESHKDSNDMGWLDIVEMVSDWTAMSQEYNQKSCTVYVENNIKKWNFSEEKQQQIFDSIKELDGRLQNLNSTQ